MSFANDTIRVPVKPMNGHNKTKNRIKSIIVPKKRKQNPYINILIQVKTKMMKENTYTFCKQKDHKVTHCDRRISIGNEVYPNYNIQFM